MTTLLAASTGGHLKQLHRLHRRLSGIDGPYRWVTFDTPQSRSLLEGEAVDFVHFVGSRDPVNLLRNLPAARRILRDHEIETVVSTGASMALPFFALARARGTRLPLHRERCTQRGALGNGACDQPDTGRLALCAVPQLGRRWMALPRLRLRFLCGAPGTRTQRIPRIGFARSWCTLGTHRGYGFTRLVRRLLAILPRETDVLWQTGDTDTGSLGIDGHRALPERDLIQAIREADAVVAHAGVGAALITLEAGKCPVLVPRRRARGEHVDDHQTQIATELGNRALSVPSEADELTLDHVLAGAACKVTTLAEDPPFITCGFDLDTARTAYVPFTRGDARS